MAENRLNSQSQHVNLDQQSIDELKAVTDPGGAVKAVTDPGGAGRQVASAAESYTEIVSAAEPPAKD